MIARYRSSLLTWHDRVHEGDEHPQVHPDYSAARQHLVCLLLLLISFVTMQSWTWFKQRLTPKQTGLAAGGGGARHWLWLPVSDYLLPRHQQPAAPHRLCHCTYYLPSCWAIDNFYIYHISLSKNHFYFSINRNLKFCWRPLHDKEMDKVNITWKKSIYITFLSLWEQCKKQLASIFSYPFHI